MKKVIIGSLVIAIIVGVVLILNSCLLFPWQWMARKNKHAALEYVNTNYSDAKFVDAYYRTTKYNPENRGYDQFIFEQSGVRFPVFVENGRIATDFYWKAFAEYQLYNTYIKPFEESRNITMEFNYYFTSDLQKFFKNDPNADISQFDGGVGFGVELYEDEKSANPRSIGWLYEFYCYCKESFPFQSYTVTIICKGSSTMFSDETVFENEDEFYSSFR